MYRKRMSLAAVLVAAGLGLTACGGGATDAGNKTSSNPSGTPSAGATVANTAYTPLTKDNFASTIAASYKDQKSAHVEMTIGKAMKASGDMNYAGGTPAMKMDMTISQSGQTIKMEELVVNGVLYMSAPGMTPAGKYIKIDSKTPGMGSLADMLGQVDPASMVTQMSKSLSDLKYVGTTTIAGDTTHHYKLIVDAKKAVSGMDLSGLPSGAANKIPKSISYDAYFNADNTLRRISMDIMGQSMQMDLTKWGEPVTITAPAKADVVEMGGSVPKMPAKP